MSFFSAVIVSLVASSCDFTTLISLHESTSELPELLDPTTSEIRSAVATMLATTFLSSEDGLPFVYFANF